MPWPNWEPPDDLNLGQWDNSAPPSPNPEAGPDTDILLTVAGPLPGASPAPLIVPWTLQGRNAQIPAKGVAGVGPQTGDSGNVFENQGIQILPGWQRYLEMAGQKQVGILPRTVAVEHNQLWDAPYVLNPSIEVV